MKVQADFSVYRANHVHSDSDYNTQLSHVQELQQVGTAELKYLRSPATHQKSPQQILLVGTRTVSSTRPPTHDATGAVPSPDSPGSTDTRLTHCLLCRCVCVCACVPLTECSVAILHLRSRAAGVVE